MSVNQTFVNKSTTYKVKRKELGNLDLGWQYAWSVTSSLNPNETGFYTIEGITPGIFTSNSCVNITFLRTTATQPQEFFNVNVIVKIIQNGVEICEQILVATVLVTIDTTEIIGTGELNSLPLTNCIFQDIKYVFQYKCNSDIDFVYFSVFNGKLYDLLGTQYNVTSDPIKVSADSDNTAEIIVSFNVQDPIVAYTQQIGNTNEVIKLGASYVISAFAEHQGKFTKMIIKRIKALPQEPEFEIFGPSEIEYDSINNYTIRVNRLSLYPSDYYLHIQYRKRYDTDDWSQWLYLQAPILLSEIGSIVNGNTEQIPYFYDFSYDETLDTYIYGDPNSIDLEFRVAIFDSYVESIFDYQYEYTNEPSNCYRDKTLEKHINLIHCPVSQDLPVGTVSYEIIKCPQSVDLIFGIVTYTVVICVETVYIFFAPVCYVWCYNTLWLVDPVCYIWCWDTYWNVGSVCYLWTYCNDTYWWWGRPCYTTTIPTNFGYIGTYPNVTTNPANSWYQQDAIARYQSGISTHGQ